METRQTKRYNLQQAAKVLDCFEEEILELALTANLPIYVENNGSEIAYHRAYWNAQGMVAHTIECSIPEGLLQLDEESIDKLLGGEHLFDARFVWHSEQNETDASLKPHEFACYENQQKRPVIRKGKLILLADDVTALIPKQQPTETSPNAAYEVRCHKWLSEVMATGKKTKPKFSTCGGDDYFQDACARFSNKLSRNSFIRAWEKAAKDHPEWATAGRRKISSAN